MTIAFIGEDDTENYFARRDIENNILFVTSRYNDYTILVKEDTPLSRLFIACADNVRRVYTKIRIVDVLYPGQKEIKPLKRRSTYDELITLPNMDIDKDKWMIDHADLILSYFENEKQQRYDLYLYAKQKGKRIVNILLDNNYQHKSLKWYTSRN